MGGGEGSRRYYHGLDAARGVLIVLGVVVHAAAVFDPRTPWLVQDPVRADIFGSIRQGIAYFRVPLFFALSGFFASISLEKTGPGPFLLTRWRRLLLPALFAGAAVNFPQDLVLARLGVPRPFAPGSQGYWVHGGWVHHLWFLLDLGVFVTLAAAASRAARRVGGAPFPRRRLPAPFLVPAILLLGLLPGVAARLLPRAVTATPLGPIDDLYSLIEGAVFFIAGLALRRPLEERVPSGWEPVVAAVAAAACAAGSSQAARWDATAGHTAAMLLDWWARMALFLAMFGAVERLFPSPRAAVSRIADSSYTIYLLHHPIVAFTALAGASLPVPVAAKFLATLAIAFGASYAFHRRVVLRVRPLRFLLNGK